MITCWSQVSKPNGHSSLRLKIRAPLQVVSALTYFTFLLSKHPMSGYLETHPTFGGVTCQGHKQATLSQHRNHHPHLVLGLISGAPFLALVLPQRKIRRTLKPMWEVPYIISRDPNVWRHVRPSRSKRNSKRILSCQPKDNHS